ncbi:glycosyltransferase family 2 protein [Marivita sp.]|uniref:glycosyltransferase family 2 protein n=1 Tax=Marivita sp. TaxID=2003365 RepID=UPI002634E43F|nr:glycosyltransferase family 2 protein [Marivita sp.]
MTLSWTLTICTYNRPHFLVETLRCALRQTRRPSEVVIVDASDNWEDNRDQMVSEFTADLQDVTLVYVPADVRSLTFQRNQALGLATSDIVFSLDDDIYLYPDAAEIVMRVYEADVDDEIAMVTGQFTPGPYEPARKRSYPNKQTGADGSQLRQWFEKQLTLDSHFVPYGDPVDMGPVPASVTHLNVFPSGLVNGGRTTFRRKFATESGWTELLRYYATHEDSDFSYRMSQFGRLVVAPDAGFFHADGNDSKASRFRINTIRVRNLLALHAVHSPNRVRSALRCAASFAKFMGLYVAIDAAQKRISFPTVRAYAYGIAQIPVFLFFPIRNFKKWYINMQERMYGDRYKS